MSTTLNEITDGALLPKYIEEVPRDFPQPETPNDPEYLQRREELGFIDIERAGLVQLERYVRMIRGEVRAMSRQANAIKEITKTMRRSGARPNTCLKDLVPVGGE